MTHRGPFQPRTLCDSVRGAAEEVGLKLENAAMKFQSEATDKSCQLLFWF